MNTLTFNEIEALIGEMEVPVEEILAEAEQYLDEAIEILENIENEEEPDFDVYSYNAAENELISALKVVYKGSELCCSYFLESLKSLKAGHIEKLPEIIVDELCAAQSDFGRQIAQRDDRPSYEILSHITNLISYVNREPGNNNDIYCHEGHSQSFRFMIKEILIRIKRGRLNMNKGDTAKAANSLISSWKSYFGMFYTEDTESPKVEIREEHSNTTRYLTIRGSNGSIEIANQSVTIKGSMPLSGRFHMVGWQSDYTGVFSPGVCRADADSESKKPPNLGEVQLDETMEEIPFQWYSPCHILENIQSLMKK